VTIARSGRLAVDAYEGSDRDDGLLAGWLSDRRVLEWFEGRDRPHDRQMIRANYGPEALAAAQVQAAIFSDNGWPLGYLRWYPMSTVVDEYDWRDDPTDVWAADIFVGDPNRWGRGLGSAALALLVEHLMVAERARRVVVDPWVGNARAIRAYEKIGFRTVGIHRGHELFEGERRDCWLMAIDALDHPVGLAARLADAGGAADTVESWARARGFDVHRSEVAPGRDNVVCVRRGSGGGRTLLLSGRLAVEGGPATSADLAAGLLAASSFAEGELAGDVIVAGVADGVHSHVGTETLVRDWKADGAVVLEPTGGVVVCRHRGVVVLDVVLTGRAAPTAQPERGLSAVSAAARVVSALEALDARWAAEASDPVFRPAAVVSRVECRGDTSTVAERGELSIHVHTTSLVASSQVDPVTTAVAEAAEPLEVSVATVLSRRPVQLRESHRLAEQALAAVSSVTGEPATAGAAPHWTVAALHALAGTPAVVYGPSVEAGSNEPGWVSTDAIRQGAAVLAALATTFCAPR
jgi:acetylornithine deacetylase